MEILISCQFDIFPIFSLILKFYLRIYNLNYLKIKVKYKNTTDLKIMLDVNILKIYFKDFKNKVLNI